MRPLVTAAGAGSLSSLLLTVLRDIHFGDIQTFAGPPPVPELCSLIPPASWSVDWPSILIGICIGLLLGPILDVLVVARVALARWARTQIAPLRAQPGPRILE